jgi:thioredoxin-dependent peroxiredoxin
MKLHAIVIALALGLVAGMSAYAADAPAMPKVGDKAPLVEGKDQAGQPWKLSDDVGKKVVLLYFYPKDDTIGCTKEACGFRDSLDALKAQNVEVIGVSFDSGDSHQKFIAKYSLNFPLIADTDGKIADAYGVRMNNRKMDNRVSFLIGLDGKIVHVTNSGDPEKHLIEMKDAAAKLKG